MVALKGEHFPEVSVDVLPDTAQSSMADQVAPSAIDSDLALDIDLVVDTTKQEINALNDVFWGWVAKDEPSLDVVKTQKNMKICKKKAVGWLMTT